MKAKKITIPARDSNGFMIGFKEVNALWECPACGGKMGNPQLTHHVEDGFFGQVHIWECPACGGKMGNPQLTHHVEDGFFGQVHIWENPCGHVAHYKNLQIVGDAE